MDNAIANKDFERAAMYRDEEIAQRENLQFIRERWELKNFERPVVDRRDIEEVVSRWTGIPLASIKEEESEKLLANGGGASQEDHQPGSRRSLDCREPFGRSRAGLKNPSRPVGSFVFLGPTGVGKTEVARSLAEFLFGDRVSR